jgi:hypothetical protein
MKKIVHKINMFNTSKNLFNYNTNQIKVD